MRKIKVVLAGFMFIITAFIIVDMSFDMTTMNVDAATLYVGGSSFENYTSINDAINNADTGDIIYVYSGEYFEDAGQDTLTAVIIEKSISLIGEDKDTTIINASYMTYGIHIKNTDYVNISGFTITGAKSVNIILTSSNHTHIEGNILSIAGSNAIVVKNGVGNLIENNYLDENFKGIAISDQSNANIVKNNIINSCGDRAISLQSQAHDNLIHSNNITGYNRGIYIYESENNRVENNHISNGEEGLSVFVVNDLLLLNNFISDNDYTIRITSASMDIVNCTLQNANLYDIWVDDPDSVNPEVTLVNTTFDGTKVILLDEGSDLTVKWYLHVKVIDDFAMPIPGVTVQIHEQDIPMPINRSAEMNYTSNSEGYVNWIPLTHYAQNHTTRTNHSLYYIAAFQDLFSVHISFVNMTANRVVTITIHDDTDGDGVYDRFDPFPNDPTQWQDSDDDGYGDNTYGNNPDAFIDDETQWLDSDGDSYGDNASGNNADAFPEDPAASLDSDGDGYPDEWNPSKTKDDSTTGLELDAYPNDPTKWKKDDGDGDNTIVWLFVCMVAIVVVVILAILSSKRKKKPTKWEDNGKKKYGERDEDKAGDEGSVVNDKAGSEGEADKGENKENST